jgi:hypothetical protein
LGADQVSCMNTQRMHRPQISQNAKRLNVFCFPFLDFL